MFDSPGAISSVPDLARKLRRVFEASSKELFDRLLEHVYHKPPLIPRLIRHALAREYIRGVPFTMKMFDDFLAETRDYRYEDDLNLLTPLRMPVLVIWGEEDRVLPLPEADIYKKILPDVKVVVMEDCGHMPQVEYPKESSEYFTRFSRRVSDL